MNAPLIFGIDAGNTRLKMALSDAQGNPTLLHNAMGEPFTPSVVFFAPEGGVLVGPEALNASFMEPARAVFNWKRHMGTDTVLYEDPDGRKYLANKKLILFT